MSHSSLQVFIKHSSKKQKDFWKESGVNVYDFVYRDTNYSYVEDLKRLSLRQIRQLKKQGNISDEWKNIFITSETDISLINQCRFYGLNRIGKLQKGHLSHKSYQMHIGLYDSTFHNVDIGNNVSINHVHLLSHYVVENNALISGVNQIVTTPFAKFGIGLLRQEEHKERQIWIEIRNENKQRQILPFLDMLCADAYLFSEFREDDVLMQKLEAMTDNHNQSNSDIAFGKIEEGVVIKSCDFIKDANIGKAAYLKGVNKVKNITIKSSFSNPVQIGEGCELVNGIINLGCTIFYGVKAIRFIMQENSSLKYGARLINSILGANSNVSCCEVLNTLTFPFHIQHHNNSFLCSSFLKGQSNVAAGATLGSNHNSRALDGELVAERGFWPGLCTSFKFPCTFSHFNMLAKGDFPFEINCPFPFALITNSLNKNELVLYPDFLLNDNAYFLFRNKIKFKSRDKRVNKIMVIEYDFIAPDTVEQVYKSIAILKKCLQVGENDVDVRPVINIENSSRPVVVKHVKRSIENYEKVLRIYLAQCLEKYFKKNSFDSFKSIIKIVFPLQKSFEWDNIGGQLIPKTKLNIMLDSIKDGSIVSWEDVHAFYQDEAKDYETQKLIHALWINAKYFNLSLKDYDKGNILTFFEYSISLVEEFHHNVVRSRSKDLNDDFVAHFYGNQKRQKSVLGTINDDPTIEQSVQYFQEFKKSIITLISSL